MPGDENSRDVVPIARIGRYRGLDGETVLHPYFDLHGENLVGKTVEIRWENQRSRKLNIEKLWWHSNKTICRFSGCENIDDARQLLHGEVFIDRHLLNPVEDDQYFAIDLLGINVVTVDGRELGRIAQVMKTGEHTVLRVEGEREYLIPFSEQIVTEVDLAAGRAVIDPPAGLLEINEV